MSEKYGKQSRLARCRTRRKAVGSR